jgi:hypothetical protein
MEPPSSVWISCVRRVDSEPAIMPRRRINPDGCSRPRVEPVFTATFVEGFVRVTLRQTLPSTDRSENAVGTNSLLYRMHTISYAPPSM